MGSWIKNGERSRKRLASSFILNSLVIKDLHAGTKEGKEILRGISLVIKKGEIHAVMGPNGGGKSTLAQVLMGHPDYVINKGTISLNGVNITAMTPDQRAKQGLFLGFQYPVEITGVNFGNFLRMAINEGLGTEDKKLSPIAFRNQVEPIAKKLGFSEDIV